MNASTLTYAAIGAVGFAILSSVATKYRGETIEFKHLGRDAFAGALLTAFVITLVPDMFPQLTILSGAGAALTAISSVASKTSILKGGGSSGISDSQEFDLQVGYPSKRY
jgi:hypothetical protein